MNMKESILAMRQKIKDIENIFILCVQQNTFPWYMAIKANNLDEEKRTFYVAITRANKCPYIFKF